MDKSQVIKQLLPGAFASFEKFNILPSVTIAQAILETGWLKHFSGNNLFGIKWTKGCRYEVQELNTYEWVNGMKTPFICKFRKYNSFEESIIDHGELLANNLRYNPVTSSKDYKEACTNLYKCGYCTDPDYPEKLISIIEDNKLFNYDNNYKNKNFNTKNIPFTTYTAAIPTSTSSNNSSTLTKESIKELQANLNKLHITDINNNPLKADGIYGPLTKTSIRKFQNILGVAEDGLWTSQLEEAINSILQRPLCSTNHPPKSLITRYIQYRVETIIDGLWGPLTDTKIKDFQVNHGLKVDGCVGEATWRALLIM